MSRREVVAWAFAVATHGAVALAPVPPRVADAAPVVVDLDLAAPVPPPPPPPPEPAPVEAPAAPAAGPSPARAAGRVSARPSAAPSAPAVLAQASDAAPEGDAPVSFADDASHDVGVGTGTRPGGGGGRRDAPRPLATAAPTATTTPLRAARIDVPGGCAGTFPSTAAYDVARVTLRVSVDADGTIGAVEVVEEEPAGQGFGEAARRCIRGGARGTPARAGDGASAPGMAQAVVRFFR